MSKTQNRNSYSCCNLILFDSFIISLCVGVGAYSYLKVPIIPSIILAILSAVVFFTLLQVKFLSLLLNVASSLIWTYVFILSAVKLNLMNDITTFWFWTVLIIVFLLTVGLHFVALESLGLKKNSSVNVVPSKDEQINIYINELIAKLETIQNDYSSLPSQITIAHISNTDRAKIINFYNSFNQQYTLLFKQIQSYINKLITTNNDESTFTIIDSINSSLEKLEFQYSCIIKMINTAISNYQEDNISSQIKPDSVDIDESLFNGCSSKEDIDKRYKALIKLYHPDCQNGDDMMMKKINITYDSLLNKIN